MPTFDRNHTQRSFFSIGAAALALLAFAATACQPQGQGQRQHAAVDTAAIKAELDSLRSAYEKAYNAGDFQTISEVPHMDMIYSPPGRPPIRGRDSIVAYEEQMRPEGATLELQPIETRVLTGEWVYEMGTGTVTFTPEGADTTQSMKTTYLAVFRRTPDGWKTYREALSAHAAPSVKQE